MVTDWNAVREQMQREEKEARQVADWIRRFTKGGGSTTGNARDAGEWWNKIRCQSNAVLAAVFEDMTPDDLATFFKTAAIAASDAMDMSHSRGYNEAWNECECD